MLVQESIRPGLEGVVAAETCLSEVDGAAGRLTIAGYDVGEFAPKATLEETAFLLWNGRRASGGELAALRGALGEKRSITPVSLHVLRHAASAAPIDALRMAVGTFVPENGANHPGTTGSVSDHDAIRLVAVFPTLVAAHHRISQGLEPIAPRSDLGHVANYLYMLSGKAPEPEAERALETYLNAAVDHGLNASTFVARAIVSTESDLVSAIVGAIGSLKGPLHGGAPGPALEMVFEIGSAGRAEGYIRAKLERGDRLMGFGHRVYKVRDPRADVLKVAVERMFETSGDRKLYDLAMHVEQTALRLLDEYKPGRNLKTNLEFYTALLLHGIGLPVELFTPTFALGRVIGWTAHAMEQRRNNRVIRPQSRYIGPKGMVW
jgi:citrate synthase